MCSVMYMKEYFLTKTKLSLVYSQHHKNMAAASSEVFVSLQGRIANSTSQLHNNGHPQLVTTRPCADFLAQRESPSRRVYH